MREASCASPPGHQHSAIFQRCFRLGHNLLTLLGKPQTRGALVTLHCPSIAVSTENKSKRSTFTRSEEHTSELQSRQYLVCRLLLEKKKKTPYKTKARTRRHTGLRHLTR